MATEMERADRRAALAEELVKRAIREGRWEVPLGWWGTRKGEPADMVVQDLEYLETHDPTEARDRLLAVVTSGADEADLPSWTEYVDDLESAVRA